MLRWLLPLLQTLKSASALQPNAFMQTNNDMAMRTKTTMTMIKIKIMRMVSTGLMMTTTKVRMITMIRDDDGADNAIMIMLMRQ